MASVGVETGRGWGVGLGTEPLRGPHPNAPPPELPPQWESRCRLKAQTVASCFSVVVVNREGPLGWGTHVQLNCHELQQLPASAPLGSGAAGPIPRLRRTVSPPVRRSLFWHSSWLLGLALRISAKLRRRRIGIPLRAGILRRPDPQ